MAATGNEFVTVSQLKMALPDISLSDSVDDTTIGYSDIDKLHVKDGSITVDKLDPALQAGLGLIDYSTITGPQAVAVVGYLTADEQQTFIDSIQPSRSETWEWNDQWEVLDKLANATLKANYATKLMNLKLASWQQISDFSNGTDRKDYFKYFIGKQKIVETNLGSFGFTIVGHGHFDKLVPRPDNPKQYIVSGKTGFTFQSNDLLTYQELVNNYPGNYKDELIDYWSENTFYQSVKEPLKSLIQYTYALCCQGNIYSYMNAHAFSPAYDEIGTNSYTDDKWKDDLYIMDYYSSRNNNSARIKKYNGVARQYYVRTQEGGRWTSVVSESGVFDTSAFMSPEEVGVTVFINV